MNKVSKPTLLLIKKIAQNNIKRMAEKAKKSHVVYRPHFKTHLSAEIGEWYREAGVSCITVSSIDMAVYFAAHGWSDITIAFPVNILQIDVLAYLSKQVKLTLVVESKEGLAHINRNLKIGVNICIKIDTGYHRTGISFEKIDIIKEVISNIEEPHHFVGLMGHFGHTYRETEAGKIRDIYNKGVKHLISIKSELEINDCKISVGDTPSCSIVDDFAGVDEIRPGNLVFYDVMQQQIGSCNFEDIAVCLAVPVVAVHEDRAEIVVHGGAVHLSKDFIETEGVKNYGLVVKLGDRDWSKPLEGFYVSSLSQEHGIISLPKDQVETIKVGDLLGILPIHSCLTANIMKEYSLMRGDKITTIHS